MDRYPDHAGRVRPGARIALLGGLLALELACAAPADASKFDAVDVPAIVAEFQHICGELEQARTGLRSGFMTDDDFADRVLDLFVRADSLHELVPRGGWTRSTTNPAGTFALSRALRYLIESLRGNYVGIAARNGINFVEADRAYQAAVAWRPELEAAAATAAR